VIFKQEVDIWMLT